MPEGKTSAKSTRRERWAWYLYDFGNSAYAAVVLLAVYSAYFQDKVVGGAEGSRLWGIAVGIAMLVVAVSSPVIGAIADYSGSKKKALLFFTIMSASFTAALFFVRSAIAVHRCSIMPFCQRSQPRRRSRGFLVSGGPLALQGASFACC